MLSIANTLKEMCVCLSYQLLASAIMSDPPPAGTMSSGGADEGSTGDGPGGGPPGSCSKLIVCIRYGSSFE